MVVRWKGREFASSIAPIVICYIYIHNIEQTLNVQSNL